MKFGTAETDMLHGPLTKKLLLFTVPIALSSIFQQLFNAADTAVVGIFCEGNALAAVGTNTETVALIVSVSSGLAVGVNILIAKMAGAGKKDDIPSAVRTAVILSVLLGIAGLAAGQFAAEPLLKLIHAPSGILRDASLYLRIYMLGYPFLLLYDFGAAVLRAKGDSGYPFFVLVASGVANVGLNLIFTVVFRMGVAGVAAATDIANGFAALTVLRRLLKENGFCGGKKGSVPKNTAEILKTGIPSAAQGAVFCLANIFVQAAVNGFGETAIAGSTIAMNFEYLTYYIITAFGQTATTFIGQNHAAGLYERCGKILRQCLLLSCICSTVPIITIVLFRNFFSGLFTPNAEIVASAAQRIVCILLFEPLCNLYEIPSGALRGSGHAVFPAVGAMISICAFRIIWIYTVFRQNPTLPWLYFAFPLSWVAAILTVNIGFLCIRRREPR